MAIVGVGLIGGSIGLDLLERGLARSVVGIGRRESSLRVARQRGAVTSTTRSIERGVAEADGIIICTPVGRIVEDVVAVASACRPEAWITDAGSTKRSIVAGVEAARRAGSIPSATRFVGSHPMAGSEQSGPAAARRDLFVERTVIVTPLESTPRGHVTTMRQLWTALGARVVLMSPEEHDTAVGAISHLPHLVASALASATPRGAQRLVGAGWRDTTRVASGDPGLWQQIFLDNRLGVLAALEPLERQLEAFRRALEQSDDAALLRLLTEAKRSRDVVGS